MNKVTFGNNIPGYEYGPADAPGVVVIQEWWGYTKELEKQAINISEKGGYRVLVPDLYKGKVGVDAEEATHLMNDLDWPTARDELTAAVDYLAQNGKKVGVVGFCMGGALTLIAAQHSKAACAAPFYGTPQEEICQVEKIKIPVLLQFGKEDKMEGFSTPKAAQGVYDKIKGAGGNVELHLYDNVGHAYMNGFTAEAVKKMEAMDLPRPDNLQEVQEQSWSRLLAFFEKHLKA
jgi:carboxymethylenebutenolidase